MDDAFVVHEIARMLGFAVPRQIGRRGTSGKIENSNPAGDVVGFFDLAAPDGTIDSFLDEIGAALAARQRERVVCLAGYERGEGGHEHGPRQQCWNINAQAAPW